MPVTAACALTVVQFGYTTLFAIYTSFIFIRIGHIAAAIACHCFCNYMGLPDLSFAWLPDKARVPRVNKRDQSTAMTLYRLRHWLYFGYGVGILLFAAGLFPLTSPGKFASPFWPPASPSPSDIA